MSDQNGLSNNVIRFPQADGITAAAGGEGTVPLTKAVNVITTCAFGHAVTLPAVAKGASVIVINKGASALTVYPGSSGTIDGLGASVAVKISAGYSQTFWRTANSPPQWQRDEDMTEGEVNHVSILERIKKIAIAGYGRASGNLLTTLMSGAEINTGTLGISMQSCALGNGNITFDSVTTKIGAGLSLSSLAAATGVVGLDIALSLNEPAADHTAGSLSTFDSVQVGENVVFGDLLYLNNDGKWRKADADEAATMPGLRLAMATIAADATGETLVKGRVRDDTWNWTVGGAIYASTTPGELTQTAPSGSGDQVQILGYAYHADKMIFDPSPVLVELV